MTGGSVVSCARHGCTIHPQRKKEGCTECDGLHKVDPIHKGAKAKTGSKYYVLYLSYLHAMYFIQSMYNSLRLHDTGRQQQTEGLGVCWIYL